MKRSCQAMSEIQAVILLTDNSKYMNLKYTFEYGSIMITHLRWNRNVLNESTPSIE